MGKVAVPALCGVTFQVKEGEFLTIFGPSGSGKSTLLHLMGDLDRPDEGKILIDGVNIHELSDSKLAERHPLSITPLFSVEWTIAAFAFAVIICAVFGLYPARKASKLNPVEALRYE